MAVLVVYLDCSIVEVIAVKMTMMWPNEVMLAVRCKRFVLEIVSVCDEKCCFFLLVADAIGPSVPSVFEGN